MLRLQCGISLCGLCAALLLLLLFVNCTSGCQHLYGMVGRSIDMYHSVPMVDGCVVRRSFS